MFCMRFFCIRFASFVFLLMVPVIGLASDIGSDFNFGCPIMPPLPFDGDQTNDKNHTDYALSLFRANHNDDTCQAQYLLAQSVVDPNVIDQYDRSTPLMLASLFGHINIVRVLLKHGADPNIQNIRGETALMHAEVRGFETTRYLLEHGADPNIQDRVGMTALIKATFNGRKKTARLLLKYGANPSIKNAKGETALYWAKRLKHFYIAGAICYKMPSLSGCSS